MGATSLRSRRRSRPIITTIYRTQVKIVADILSATQNLRSSSEDEEGIGITHLLRGANVSYTRLVRVLNDLISAGLLQELEPERGNSHRYRISDRGIQFLAAYRNFEEFTRSFGLRL